MCMSSLFYTQPLSFRPAACCFCTNAFRLSTSLLPCLPPPGLGQCWYFMVFYFINPSHVLPMPYPASSFFDMPYMLPLIFCVICLLSYILCLISCIFCLISCVLYLASYIFCLIPCVLYLAFDIFCHGHTEIHYIQSLRKWQYQN